MRIFIGNIPFDVSTGDTAMMLKQTIQNTLGYPAIGRNRIYRVSGEYLVINHDDHDKTLGSLGVTEGDRFAIDLGMQRSMGGRDSRPRIYITFPGEGSMYSYAEDTDTIEYVKASASSHSGIPKGRMTLTFQGVPLNGNKTLKECGIETRLPDVDTLVVVVDNTTLITSEQEDDAYRQFRQARDEKRRLKLQAEEEDRHTRGERFVFLQEGSSINSNKEDILDESEIAIVIKECFRTGFPARINISSPGAVHPVIDIQVKAGSHEIHIGYIEGLFKAVPSAIGLPKPPVVPIGTVTNLTEAMTMIKRHFGLIQTRNIVEGSENALSYEDITEGNLMVNFPRTASKNGEGRHTEYNFSTYYKNSPSIRGLTQNPETRYPLTPGNFTEYIAHLVPKKGGSKKTRRTRRSRITRRRRAS
jgi:hypothetical protein